MAKFLIYESDNWRILAFFGLAIIGLMERLAVKRKSPRLEEGFKTWCGLLCAYRTKITEELRYRLEVFNDKVLIR